MSNVRPPFVRPLAIRDDDPRGAEAIELLRGAASEARELYPELHPLGSPAPTNVPTPPRGVFILASQSGSACGCGALRQYNEHTAEIRRVFVRKNSRRAGIARQMLAQLEQRAVAFGFKLLRLTTGDRQLGAMALYESLGFHRVPTFSEYADDPTSVCYEKALDAKTEV